MNSTPITPAINPTISAAIHPATSATPHKPPTQTQDSTKVSKRAIAAAVAGNALEYYDFIVYAFFAVYIGKAFFPSTSEYGSLLASVATFGVGFLFRPLGGILIGSFADRAGRKPAMLITVALITVGTLGMALTPSYASIGVAAPVIVVVCRLLQGLALGGEVGPASAMLVEAAEPGKRGRLASWQVASQGAAMAVGGIAGILVSASLTHEQLASWGWRLPFILSLALIPIAIYMRAHLPETLETRDHTRTGMQLVGEVLHRYRRMVVLGLLMMMSGAVSTQIGNYMTTYAIQTLKLPATIAQASTLLGGVSTFAFALLAGWACDRFGRKAVMIWPRVLLALTVVPMFLWLDGSPSIVTLLLVTLLVTSLTAASGAASLVVLPEMMPRALRSTGTSVVYAVGVTLFGGGTQFFVTWLLATTGNPLAPAYLVVVTSIISLIAMCMLPETRDVDVTL